LALLLSLLLVLGILVPGFIAFNRWVSKGPDRLEQPLPSATSEVPMIDTSNMEPRVVKLVNEARQGVVAQPKDAVVWGRFGAALDAHGEQESARTAYERARELNPLEFRWVYNLADVTAQQNGEPDQVAALYEEAAKLAPTYAPLGTQLGNFLAKAGLRNEAAAAYRRTLALDDDFAMAHRGLGQVLLADGDIGNTIPHLERAAALLPNDSVTRSALAQAFRRKGDSERANAEAALAAKLSPQHYVPDPVRDEVRALAIGSAACAARAAAAMRAKKYDDAIRDMLIFLEVYPNDPHMRFTLGTAYMFLGKLPEARTAFEKTIELKPDHDQAHVELGRVVTAQGNVSGAIELLRRAVEIAPKNGSAHAKLANALAKQNNAPDAITHYALAIENGERTAETFTNWAVALQMTGDAAGAIERCQDALAVDPQYLRAHFEMGLAKAKLGRYAEAAEHLQDAVAINPEHAEALFQMGRALEELGRFDDAMRAYEQGVTADPKHRMAGRLTMLQETRRRSGSIEQSPSEATETWRPQKPEFEAIARRLMASDQQFYGRAPLERLREEVKATNLTALARIERLSELAREALEWGEVKEAVAAVTAAFELVESVPGRAVSPKLQRLRGVVHLREAEVENCIRRHNADCCIFPLAGLGVHVDREPAEKAFASYLAYLETDPNDLTARWLLNLLGMALGEYPQRLPPQYVIPQSVFDSDYDIKRFPDIAPALGVATSNLAGGVSVDDFDGDGLLDILTSTCHPLGPLTFYRNVGDGTFEDASARARTDDQFGGLNMMSADYDNDGDLDALILRGAWLLDDGRIRKSLLRNDGHGVFTDVTRAAGLAIPACPTQTAAFADFDNDGDLDLYVGNESRRAWEKEAGDYPGQLFLNNGNGTFTDIAKRAGVTNDRYCKGVAAGDYDNDGDMDLYLSNSGPNRLFKNNGDLTFTDVTNTAGVAEPVGRSFSTWFFDYDNDGWLDLFVCGFDAIVADVAADYLDVPDHATRPRLYHNNRDGTFKDITRQMGLDHAYRPMGTNFGDLDNDGWLDIYLTTGDPDYETLMPNIMLRNDGGRRFQDVTKSGGLGHLQKGHGVAFADIDHDGDQDIYNQLGGFYPGDVFPNSLYLNPGHGNHFLTIKLIGVTSNRNGVGARITVRVSTPSGPRTLHRAVGSVSSFGGSPIRQEIGLGDATKIDSVEVYWPASGTMQKFADVPLDRFIKITEAQEVFEELPFRAIELQR